MSPFKTLFGIKAQEVKKNCILLPMLPRGILEELKVKSFFRGKLYGAGSAVNFTLIHTGLGAGLVGDAVLYLKEETICKNVILFGSCGLIRRQPDLSVGSLVSPFRCYSNESFTDVLLERNLEPKAFYPSRPLFESFLKINQNAGIKQVTCSTVPSLKLEEVLIDSFIKNSIEIVDMECSSFFAACSFIGLRAVAFFYIADIIKEKPFYKRLSPDLKSAISSSIKKAIVILCRFIEENLSD